MGELCTTVLGKTFENQNTQFSSAKIFPLFVEFLGRYKELKAAKFQKHIAMVMVVLPGVGAITIPGLLPNLGFVISIPLLLLFYLATRRYLEISERMRHLTVNVYILHHHLIGKLEVGFCGHAQPCHCGDDFRRHILEKYGICLNDRILK